MEINPKFLVVISADAEWGVICDIFSPTDLEHTPYGEWFTFSFHEYHQLPKPVVFMHGGWGKVAAAASMQYAISRWHPQLVINLGTCGGFAGMINNGEIILVNKTVIYDIYEQMGDPEVHLRHYMAELDTSWISQPFPIPVRYSVLVSGDRDIFSTDIPGLFSKYGAVAGDWESGAIAWVANKNHTRCLILRGVTDLVGETGGDAYNGNVNFYYENTRMVMKTLVDSLPQWLIKFAESDLVKAQGNR